MNTSQSKQQQLRSDCPVNYLVEALGDKWSLLILRDMVFWGKKTHGEFMRSKERIATNILADRLQKLEQAGILAKTADPLDKRRDIYVLTEKGLGLVPLLLDMVVWSTAFGTEYLRSSPQLVSDLQQDRNQVIATITQDVRAGGFIFAHPEWMQIGG
jgi:DNA-binding HxlR family transcriptional regulator